MPWPENGAQAASIPFRIHLAPSDRKTQVAVTQASQKPDFSPHSNLGKEMAQGQAVPPALPFSPPHVLESQRAGEGPSPISSFLGSRGSLNGPNLTSSFPPCWVTSDGLLNLSDSRTATWENGEKTMHGDSGGGPVQNLAWQLIQGGHSGGRGCE